MKNFPTFLLPLLLGAVAMMASCSSQVAVPAVNPPGSPVSSAPATPPSPPANPRAMFVESCAKCHGENGEGRSRGIPLIKGHALFHDEEDMVKAVTEGRKGKDGEMPAFRGKLTEEEIRALIRFVRTEIQQGAADKAGHQH